MTLVHATCPGRRRTRNARAPVPPACPLCGFGSSPWVLARLHLFHKLEKFLGASQAARGHVFALRAGGPRLVSASLPAPFSPFGLSCIGEGNGNPLQYSCLGNPRDGGAWWAAVYGVTQSVTTEETYQQQQQMKEANLIHTV